MTETQHTYKILVVDDEPDLEHLMRQRLRREVRSGRYELHFAQNGVEALERLKEVPGVYMVLTDINMPRMDGLTLLGEISNISPDLRAVVVSAYGDMKNIRTAMNRGAFDFVTKPIDFQDLRVTIERTLKSADEWYTIRESQDRLVKIQNELNVASDMQQSILPTMFPQSDHCDIFGNMESAREVGGDFYDVFSLPDGRIGLAIADVSDKGVPAALFMMSSRILMKGSAIGAMNPGTVLKEVNNLLSEENEKAMFVTAFYSVYTPDSGNLHYANGGHNPPLIIHPDGATTLLPNTNGIALGVFPDLEFDESDIRLSAGDLLVLYTDGVTEAMNADGEEFGMDRLEKVFSESRPDSTEAATSAIFDAVHDFAGETPQSDDITCITVLQNRDKPMSKRISLSLSTRLGQLDHIYTAVNTVSEDESWSEKLVYQIKLVLEELVVNIITHGYKNEGRSEFEVHLDTNDEKITIELRDYGKAFNPLSDSDEPDVDAELDDRPIGGLGIFLVQSMMDELSYRREDDQNILTIVKYKDNV